MKIKRIHIENEIEEAISRYVDKKSLRLVLPEIYDDFMKTIVEAINEETDIKFIDRVDDIYMVKKGGSILFSLLEELAKEWGGKIYQHILLEGYPKGSKFKFKKSSLPSIVATDEIVLDLEYTSFCFNNRHKEINNISLVDEIDDNPDLETLNSYYDYELRKKSRKDLC